MTAEKFVPFGAGAEIGRYFTRAANKQRYAAAITRTTPAPVMTAGRGKVA